LVQTAVFCHYRPLVALGIAAVFSKILFYLLQGFVYRTIPNTSNLQVFLYGKMFELFASLFRRRGPPENLCRRNKCAPLQATNTVGTGTQLTDFFAVLLRKLV
jgi:hypothetical protein